MPGMRLHMVQVSKTMSENENTLVRRRVPIASLHRDPENVRKHDERNLESIKASLLAFGQVEPLVVQASTGKVVGGNGRVEAMLALGWSECDVTEVELSDEQARALAIALNRTAELADWDEAALAEQLRALQADDPALLAAAGFYDEEVDELFERLAEEADDEALPAPEAPKEHVEFDAAESQVRMVQLYLTVGTFPRFQEMVEALGKRYGVDNATDTVMRALEAEMAAS